MFFCISDLASVDPMYQYSLTWFISLFNRAMDGATQASIIEKRVQNLNEYFTYSLYVNVCRSLFEKHKLMFSLMLCIKILQVCSSPIFAILSMCLALKLFCFMLRMGTVMKIY